MAVTVFGQHPQSDDDQATWRGTWDWDGGAIAMDDPAARQLRWHNDALGSRAVTMLTDPGNRKGTITGLAEHGTLRINCPAVNHIEAWILANCSPDDAAVEQVSDQHSLIRAHAATCPRQSCQDHGGIQGAIRRPSADLSPGSLHHRNRRRSCGQQKRNGPAGAGLGRAAGP